ncbi:MAG: endopeptidase La [Chloroflexota bacterium]
MTNNTSELYEIPGAVPDENGIIEIALIPVTTLVVYPDTVRPMNIATHDAEAAIEIALAGGLTAGLFAIDDPIRPLANGNMPTIGTEVAVRPLPALDGIESVLVQGRRRIEFIELTQTAPYYICRARVIDESYEHTPQVEASMRAAVTLFRRVITLSQETPAEMLTYARETKASGTLADLIASTLTLTLEERVQVLRTVDPVERLRLITQLLGKEITLLELEEEIEYQVQQEMEREQRELYLREQMRVIQSELGETDIFQQEINELRDRVIEADLPPEVYGRAMKEISRLAMMPPMAPEIGLIHSYIDWIVSLPWRQASEDNLDIANAQQVLDEDHYGLARVKDRVLEHIAVRKLAAEKMQTPILCFLGPPGTGKTSLGKSIARALGREFVRVSLGGVRDEAEIRGHRRTYIGAMPGRIIQTMKRAGTVNPVLMLDEIDKLGMDFHGDPAAALLEVLDPEQNSDFQDHYMDMPYDLSQVLFITTANDLYPLPPALEDRLEIIEFPGYIEEDKLAIAQNYLIPKQLESHGLDDSGVKFESGTLQTLVREYTYEAGVRSLNRRIAEVMRKIARQSAEGKKYPKRVRATMLDEMIGPPDYTLLRANDEDQVGVVTGMAWTSGGGDVMTIEVSLLPGKGSLTLTGQLGDVMQESAQAALSFMRRHADRLDVPHDDFEDFDLHIHLPEGAVPKDGPSAGITLAIAIISVFTEQKVRSNYAMTGEITLRGKVLPVGGIREKIMAARRAQITNIIIPEVNQRDLVEIPKQALRNLNIVPVSDMQQVMDLVLHDPPPEGRARDAESDDNSSSDDENDE